MNDNAATDGPAGLELLLFRVGGVCFGIDAGQVEKMDSCGAEAPAGALWFHDLLDFGTLPVAYREPTLLSIKAPGETVGVIVDAVQEIAEFPFDAIRPFPPLVEPFALAKGMWGVLQRGEEIVPLLDFQRLRPRIAALQAQPGECPSGNAPWTRHIFPIGSKGFSSSPFPTETS